MRFLADRELPVELSGLAFSESCEGPDEGLAVCQGGRVTWASERMAELLGCESPRDLIGACLSDLDVELVGCDREWGSARGCDGQLAPASNRRGCLRGHRVPLMEGELWVVDGRESDPAREMPAFDLRRALAAAKREIAELRDQLQRERADRGELLDILGHELRTPMTVVNGYNRLLLSGQLGAVNGEQRKALQEVVKSGRRLDGFMQNLIEAAHEGILEGALEIAPRNLGETLKGVHDLLIPLIEEKSLKVEFRIDPNATAALFDQTRIEQVITNLLTNAIKFSERGDLIRVTTRSERLSEGRFVEISVSDQGPGIDRRDRQRVFESYVRVGDRTKTDGLGLGLTICRRIVTAHGGKIEARETLGGGARLVFTLPAVEGVSGAEEFELTREVG